MCSRGKRLSDNQVIMLFLRRWATSILVLGVIFFPAIPSVSAQIVELREYHGKQIGCARSGLSGFAMPCGADGGYEFVFIGSVLSAKAISATEWRLQLMPEETFHGNPAGELTVITNQGACLPEIHAGDRWLFYLQKNDHKPNALILSYGSPSKPMPDAAKDLAFLQRLEHLFDEGIITGFVQRPEWDAKEKVDQYLNVAGHKIVARNLSNGTEYAATTDKEGNYEFTPLPSGKYNLSANTAEGVWAEEGSVQVRPGSCTHVSFALRPNRTISGNVRTASGQPASYVQVAVVPAAEDGSFTSALSDEQGNFEIKGLLPGR